MSNFPFNRTAINVRERPMSSDINRAQSELDRTIRDLLMAQYLPRGGISPDNSGLPVTGMIGDGLKVRPVSPVSMSIQVNPGLGFVYDVAHSDLSIGGVNEMNDLSVWKPLVLNGPAPTIPLDVAPGGGSSRYDIVEVRTNRLFGESTSRDVLNVISGAFEAQVVNKSLDWSLEGSIGKVTTPALSTAAISLKAGVAAPSPSPPGVTPGYTQIAQILVGSGVTTIDSDKIVDFRRQLFPCGVAQFATEIVMAAGATTLTMNELHAPPGLVMCAVGNSFSPPVAIEIYIFPGSTLSRKPLLHANAYVASAAAPAWQQVSVVSGFATLAVQSAVAGASAAPTLKVAVGQPYYKAVIEAPGNGTATPSYFRVFGSLIM